ncbi:MAG: LysM peptidoglycan-binding domain-containing protein [Lachnospiraceae bacterium]|nr:LysM peptidoglycan-binding domain-containing protein [Lachnospiraceae bacterium]
MNRDYERIIRNNRRRRARQLRKHIIMFLSTVLMIIVVSFGMFSMHVKADTKDSVHIYKYYKNVTVTKDDTLWGYAKQYAPDGDYEKYIREVKRTNNLQDDNIQVSSNIILPYYSEEFLN